MRLPAVVRARQQDALSRGPTGAGGIFKKLVFAVFAFAFMFRRRMIYGCIFTLICFTISSSSPSPGVCALALAPSDLVGVSLSPFVITTFINDDVPTHTRSSRYCACIEQTNERIGAILLLNERNNVFQCGRRRKRARRAILSVCLCA